MVVVDPPSVVASTLTTTSEVEVDVVWAVSVVWAAGEVMMAVSVTLSVTVVLAGDWVTVTT